MSTDLVTKEVTKSASQPADVTDDSCRLQYIEIVPHTRDTDRSSTTECDSGDWSDEVKQDMLSAVKREPHDLHDNIHGDMCCTTSDAMSDQVDETQSHVQPLFVVKTLHLPRLRRECNIRMNIGCDVGEASATIADSYSNKFTSRDTTRLSSLNDHASVDSSGGQRSYTANSYPRQVSCTICGKVLNCKSMKRHMCTHTGGQLYVCYECSKTFSSSFSLKLHMRTHSGEQPYNCEACGKKFMHSSNMRVHMRTHTREQPYICNVCGKKFARSSDLKRHIRSHTGEQPFGCIVCNKRFAHSSHLKRHMRTHSDELSYSCDVCKRKFGDLAVLKRHERIHAGGQLYSCNVCLKKFARSYNLKRHVFTHTGQQPYCCKICGKKYLCSDSLNVHMSTHIHSDTDE